jgi:hypothetical protein
MASFCSARRFMPSTAHMHQGEMHMSRVPRTAGRAIPGAIVVTAALATAGAAPAGAAVLATGGGSSPAGGSIGATCAGPAGLNTDFDRMTYAVDVAANATHRSPAVFAVGTVAVCKVVDARDGAVFGSVRGGQPGPVAVGAGVVSFPSSVEVKACIEGHAVFSDGSTASFSTC